MNRRRLFTYVGLGALLALLAGQVRGLLRDPSIWPPDDFVEYWAAARLALEGHNPYDPNLLLPLQRTAGRDTAEAVMMWNPPWSLAVVLPLGLMPAREGQLAWLLVNLAAIAFCGDRLWLRYGGRREDRWQGWLMAGAFVPTLFSLHAGQIGPLSLLGAVLFVEAMSAGRPVLAGAATVLVAIKPHLAFLLWTAILCDAVARRRFGIILGGVLAGMACSAIALSFDPDVLSQYYDAMAHRPPEQWVSPTLGTVLRIACGPDLFRLQFLPVLVGLAWFALYWHNFDREWNWTEQTPQLLLVSFVAAPYGAWPFDLVLLLPASFQMALSPAAAAGMERPNRRVATVLIGINAACLLMNAFRTGSFWFLWVAPALLLAYAAAMRPRPKAFERPASARAPEAVSA